MMNNSTDKNYSELFRNYLERNEKRFAKTQLSYYYRYLESFFWMKINDGQLEYRSEVFKIYKLMISKNIYVLENTLNDIEFNNVINIALPLGEFNWVDKFIERHKKYLRAETANETYNLSKAKLFFYWREFDKALLNLNNVHFKNSHYYINSKFLLARVLYETNSFESIPYVLGQLIQYTRRGKNVTRNQIKNIKTFKKYFLSLLRLREKFKDSEYILLKKQLNNEKTFVAGKNWFYEKIEELEK